MRSGHKHLIAAMCTGGGKTAVFAWMADASQKKGSTVWFIVHRIELLDQTFATFEKFNIPLKTVHIGMVAGFANHPNRYPKPDLIIFDECHHSSSATWMKIINANPDAFIIGLTATPTRLSGKPLGDIYTDIVIGADTGMLIDSGYLAPYRYFSFSKVDVSALKKRGGDYSAEDTEKLMMTKAIYGDTILNYKKIADGRQTICFCTTIKHSQAVAESFVDAGYNAVHFDGETPKQERDRIIQDFRAGKIQILTNCALISEGFDLDAIDCVIQLRPTASLVLYLQCVGRCLRPKEGKTAIIIDQVGNYMNFGLPSDPREWSLSDTIRPGLEYGEDGRLTVRQCLQCFYTFKTGPQFCPNCGALVAMTRKEIENIKKIKLEEVKQELRVKADETVKEKAADDCRSLMELQAYARAKGYKAGWAWMQAKRRGLIRA